MKVIAENRKARHDYLIEECFETGIELKGTEVKSMRAGRANLKDSFAVIENGELYLYGMHISPYEHGNIFNVEPMRPRKLLMHKKEIMRLLGKTKEQGLTLVPVSYTHLDVYKRQVDNQSPVFNCYKSQSNCTGCRG